jgi:hypothetical protein
MIGTQHNFICAAAVVAQKGWRFTAQEVLSFAFIEKDLETGPRMYWLDGRVASNSAGMSRKGIWKR